MKHLKNLVSSSNRRFVLMKNKVFYQLFLSSAVLVSMQSAQANGVFAQCVTESPTTSFLVQTVGEKVQVDVYHHNGIQYAPFWNTIIVPNDLENIKVHSDLVMKLNPHMTAFWKKSDCNLISAENFVCIGTAEKMKVNGIEIDPWAVYSSQHSEASFAGEFKHTEIAFRFYVGQIAHQFVMKYGPGECLMSNKPLSKGSAKK
jgi:hypothetical protein